MLRKWSVRFISFVGALAVLAAVAYGVVYFMAGARLARHYKVTHETLEVPTDAAAVARGRHLAEAVAGCADCHGPDLGGRVMVENFPLGRLVAPNLTSGQGGRGAGYRVEDWVRTLRHGVDPTGRPLIIMPSDVFHNLSVEDLGALVAFLRQAPAVDRDLGPSRIGPLARVLFIAGKLPLLPAERIDHDSPPGAAPIAEASPAYGRYLVETAGCAHCHRPDLSGGPMPGAPPGSAVPPRIARLADAGWAEADFVKALRQGVRPDGRTLSDAMPWKALGHMDDLELRAVWLYLNSVTGKPNS